MLHHDGDYIDILISNHTYYNLSYNLFLIYSYSEEYQPQCSHKNIFIKKCVVDLDLWD